MLLKPNPSSGVPIYLQLMEQVKHGIETGALRPGEQLPGIRPLAEELVINPNTVAKAYRELEHEGIVEGRQGVGTFVCRRPDGPPPGTQARLARSLSRWVDSARSEGLDDDAIEAMVRDMLRARNESRIA